MAAGNSGSNTGSPPASIKCVLILLLTFRFLSNIHDPKSDNVLWQLEPLPPASTIVSCIPFYKDWSHSSILRSGDIHVHPGPASNITPTDFNAFPRKGLTFLNINARSLIPKLAEIKIIAQQTNAAVISITESWLDHTVTDNEINIDGYTIIRCDRNRNGGGACTYIRSDLSFNPR